MSSRAERSLPIWTGLGVLALYLAFPSYRYNFDGVACAIAVELGDLKHLVHGNHLLYGLVGLLFHRGLALLGAGTGALAALQLLDSLLGAAGAALFQHALRRAGFSGRVSFLCALGLALSHGYWLWSLEAQVYALGAFFLAGALREALGPAPSAGRLALWHGLAMLTHGANALWTPAALYALRRAAKGPREFRSAAFRYFLLAAGLVILGYALAAAFCVKPKDADELKLWLLGSAALGPGRSVLWHGAGFWKNLGDWLLASGEIVSPFAWLGLPLWGAAAWTLARERRFRPAVVLAWLWLPAYALLFTQWEPFSLVYRVSDLIPLWLLAAAAAHKATETRLGGGLALAFLGLLAAANFWGFALPNSDPNSNREFTQARWIGANTPEDAWIAAEHEEEVYLPYFAGRATLNLRYFEGRPEALAARVLELMESGRPVFISSKRLRGSRALPAHLGLKAVAHREGLSLFEITSVAD